MICVEFVVAVRRPLLLLCVWDRGDIGLLVVVMLLPAGCVVAYLRPVANVPIVVVGLVDWWWWRRGERVGAATVLRLLRGVVIGVVVVRVAVVDVGFVVAVVFGIVVGLVVDDIVDARVDSAAPAELPPRDHRVREVVVVAFDYYDTADDYCAARTWLQTVPRPTHWIAWVIQCAEVLPTRTWSIKEDRRPCRAHSVLLCAILHCELQT